MRRFLAIALLASLAFPAAAQAQVKLRPLTGDVAKDLNIKPTTTAAGPAATSTDEAMSSFGSQVRKITKEIVDKAIADVQSASDDAAIWTVIAGGAGAAIMSGIQWFSGSHPGQQP
jgi:hypothetical protein